MNVKRAVVMPLVYVNPELRNGDKMAVTVKRSPDHDLWQYQLIQVDLSKMNMECILIILNGTVRQNLYMVTLNMLCFTSMG